MPLPEDHNRERDKASPRSHLRAEKRHVHQREISTGKSRHEPTEKNTFRLQPKHAHTDRICRLGVFTTGLDGETVMGVEQIKIDSGNSKKCYVDQEILLK